jgi:DNA invertase Pin-like site-specific DNA recombinase
MKRTRTASDARLAIAYLRVSTDDQHLGPEAQRAAIVAWAAREGVNVAAWHTDQGVSGATELDGRPGLAAALADLRVRGAGVLAVAKRDRLARDVYVAATIDRAVGALGARVVCADGAGNGTSPADAFMRTILDSAAAYERAMIAARTKAALAVKRARGEASNHAPYGFRAVEGRLVADEGEQAVIARVREARARGLTVRAIAEELAAAGIVSRKGRPLHFTAVGDILNAAA